VSYRQPEIVWEYYSIVTSSNTEKTFSCANLKQIVLDQASAVSENQNPSTGKPHYGPFIYRIDFHIDVTVRTIFLCIMREKNGIAQRYSSCLLQINFPNDPLPHRQIVTVLSAPYGLTTHSSQEAILLSEVFLKDLTSWEQTPTTASNNPTTLPPTATIENIVDGVRRYFIHKTGIRPKEWIMPYIESTLKMVCSKYNF
jgi:hypothetical protein